MKVRNRENNMIKVNELMKEFVKHEKNPDKKGFLKFLKGKKRVVKQAVKSVSFEIPEGEIVGYIGTNGAGKSTTIKMLTGILQPTSGEVLVNGIDPYKNRIETARNIGVVFGQRTNLWWDLPLIETFNILKEIYNITKEDFKERMEFFNNILALDEFINSPVRTLSLGQRMRGDIAASLIHNPKILLLDEPTIGLDVFAKHKMREAIKEMNDKFDTTIILTTHDLEDVEELCSRIIMIDKGQIIYDGDLKKLKKITGNNKLLSFQLKVIEDISFPKEYEKGIKYKLEQNTLSVDVNQDVINVQEVIKYAIDNFVIEDITISDVKLDNVVKKVYTEGI